MKKVSALSITCIASASIWTATVYIWLITVSTIHEVLLTTHPIMETVGMFSIAFVFGASGPGLLFTAVSASREKSYEWNEQFVVFLKRHPVLLFIMAMVPLLYAAMCALIFFFELAWFGVTETISSIKEWCNDQWFDLTCWWDDFKLMNL